MAAAADLRELVEVGQSRISTTTRQMQRFESGARPGGSLCPVLRGLCVVAV